MSCVVRLNIEYDIDVDAFRRLVYLHVAVRDGLDLGTLRMFGARLEHFALAVQVVADT